MTPYATEMALVPVLKEMESTGILLDCPRLMGLGEELKGEMDALEREWGHHFPAVSITSPHQISDWFFGWELWPTEGMERTEKGKLSANVNNVDLAFKHPDTTEEGREAARVLSEHAQRKTIYNTFTHALVARARQHPDSRLRCSFTQHVTDTFRLSCTDPNLQNIPTRTEMGRRVREAFIPTEGMVLLVADYDRLELGVLAHYAGEGKLRDLIHAGDDPFQATADECGIERGPAKNAFYAIIYGGGAFRISKTAGIPFDEAEALLRRIHSTYPEVKSYGQRAIKFAERNGLTRSMGGYIRTLPDIHSKHRSKRGKARRCAQNTPIQGTAAWIVKLAMLQVHERMTKAGLGTQLLQVHDEIVAEAPEGSVEEAVAVMQDCMEGAVELKVPLRAAPKWGPNWATAKGE